MINKRIDIQKALEAGEKITMKCWDNLDGLGSFIYLKDGVLFDAWNEFDNELRHNPWCSNFDPDEWDVISEENGNLRNLVTDGANL